MKIKATISYDGSFFFGFQRQTERGKERHITVESRFEEALKSIGIHSKILGSGRTDRGVHGSGQVISFDAPDFWKDLVKLKRSLNMKLDKKIVVRTVEIVHDDFHPRYDAKKRLYRYLISTKDVNPFSSDYVTFKNNLDLKKCNESLALFIGEHDFEFFRKTGSDESSTVREIYNCFAYRHKEFIVLHIEGDGFLRSQVRLMVAAIFDYSDGKITLENIKKQLKKEEKTVKKPAPCEGLYLAKIKY